MLQEIKWFVFFPGITGAHPPSIGMLLPQKAFYQQLTAPPPNCFLGGRRRWMWFLPVWGHQVSGLLPCKNKRSALRVLHVCLFVYTMICAWECTVQYYSRSVPTSIEVYEFKTSCCCSCCCRHSCSCWTCVLCTYTH